MPGCLAGPQGAEAEGCSTLQCQASSPQQSPGQVLVGQQLGKPLWLVPSHETNYIWWTSVLGSGATGTSPEIPKQHTDSTLLAFGEVTRRSRWDQQLSAQHFVCLLTPNGTTVVS